MAKTGPKPKPTICHPERKHRCFGLCNACYQRQRARLAGVKELKRNTATCHPDRYACGHGLCKQCYGKQHYLKSKKESSFVIRRRRNTRRWYRENKQAASDYQRNKNQTQKAEVTAKRLGVSVEEVRKALLVPHCEICGGTFKLAVDHCHDTGKVRGRLCAKCNMAIGLLNEDRQRVMDVAKYLDRI